MAWVMVMVWLEATVTPTTKWIVMVIVMVIVMGRVWWNLRMALFFGWMAGLVLMVEEVAAEADVQELRA